MAATIASKPHIFMRLFACRLAGLNFRTRNCVSGVARRQADPISPMSTVYDTVKAVNHPLFRWRHQHRPLATTATSTVRSCWQCSETVGHDTLLCDRCGVVQPVSERVNYFGLFGFEPRYNLDSADLTSAFRRLQGRLHPDKFAGKSERERDLSSECSSLLNVAYQTLNSPYERGHYLMRLHGRVIGETGGAPVDPDLLMDVMEKNEALADAGLTVDELRRIDTENKRTVAAIVPKLTAAFGQGDMVLVETLLAELKYFANIDAKVRSLELKFNIMH